MSAQQDYIIVITSIFTFYSSVLMEATVMKVQVSVFNVQLVIFAKMGPLQPSVYLDILVLGEV